MFRPILFLAVIRLDIFIGENYTLYNMTQYNHQCWCKYSIYTNTDGYNVSYYIV